MEYPTLDVKRFVGEANSLTRISRHPIGMAKETFADRLKELRRQSGRSQVEVADAVGIDRSTLAGLEAGHDMPGRETVRALAQYYVVSIDWLLTGEGEPQPPRALTINEELLLNGYRQLPTEEADAILRIILSRSDIQPPPAPARRPKRGRA